MYRTSFFVSVVLSALLAVLRLAVAAPVHNVEQATVGSIFSVESRRFLMFSAEGKVTANGDFRKCSKVTHSSANIAATPCVVYMHVHR